MTAIVDSRFILTLALTHQIASAIDVIVEAWASDNESLHAPPLLDYEVTDALTRLVHARQLSRPEAHSALALVHGLNIRRHLVDGSRAMIDLALQLERPNALDAAYLMLSRTLAADLWTVDRDLARDATSLGFRVRLVSA